MQSLVGTESSSRSLHREHLFFLPSLQAVWLLCGMSIALILLLMVFLTMNCLTGCSRKLTASVAQTSSAQSPSWRGKPMATHVTHDSIQLEWTKPEQSAHKIKSYVILYHSVSDPSNSWIQYKVKSTTETLNVSELSEHTSYQFKVRLESDTGDGLESDISDPIQTKKITPSMLAKPKVLNVTHDSVLLEWTKLEQGDYNITSYTLCYCSDGNRPVIWSSSKHNATLNREVLLTQLTENTKYSFKIRAEYKTGIRLESDFSEPIRTKMMIPGKPGKPKASNVTHDSIQLEWTKPDQGAHNVTTYTIFYRSTSDPSDKWSEYEVDTNEKVLLQQFSENTAYCFKVRPKCEDGPGLESDVSDPIHTKMIIPGKPGKPRVSNVTHNSIQLEWTKPKEGAYNVTTYVVFYRHISNPPDEWTKVKTTTAEERVTVSDLLETTIYEFKIQPECKYGFGKDSDRSEPIKTQKKLTFTKAIRKLWSARKKWYYIGLCLGINRNDLDAIEVDNPRDTDSCLRKMLTSWFDQVEGTWQMLIDALRNDTVGFNELANSIAVETFPDTTCSIAQSGEGFKCPLCGICSLENYLKGKCPKFSSSSELAFPFLDTNTLTNNERLTLHTRLIKETENIINEFDDLIDQILDSFYEMSEKELHKAATMLSISSPIPKLDPAGFVIRCLKEKTSFF